MQMLMNIGSLDRANENVYVQMPSCPEINSDDVDEKIYTCIQ